MKADDRRSPDSLRRRAFYQQGEFLRAHTGQPSNQVPRETEQPPDDLRAVHPEAIAARRCSDHSDRGQDHVVVQVSESRDRIAEVKFGEVSHVEGEVAAHGLIVSNAVDHRVCMPKTVFVEELWPFLHTGLAALFVALEELCGRDALRE